MTNFSKIILGAAFLLLAAGATAQTTVKADANGQLTSVNASKAKQAPELTNYTYKAKDGKIYKVFKGSKGGFFINRVSKKSGKSYKQYLKIQK